VATVILPRSLIALFPAAEHRATVPGSTVADVIDSLEARWPGMRDRLCQPGPAIREHINLYVDGQPADIDATVGEASVVHIIPAVAGGS
jgi:molybdopterin synthase sulfur carrier subunit